MIILTTFMMELGILLFIYLSTMVVIASFKKDTSVANFTWGGGVLLVTVFTFFHEGNFLPQQIEITFLTAIWALRLIAYIYMRYDGKDPRFTSWKWQGVKALFITIVWVFGQLIMIAIMSYPALLVNTYNAPRTLSLFDLCGIALWIFGFYWEAVSDSQLFNFKKHFSNTNAVLNTGLWRYSRHPNYFGESLMWHGIFLLALSVPNGWTAIIAPLTITFFLVQQKRPE